MGKLTDTQAFRPVRTTKLLLATVAILGTSGTAQAHDDSHHFTIRSQDAATALQVYAKQSGKQVLFAYDAVAGRKAASVNGTLTDKNALQRLIKGTGLQITSFDGATVTVAAAQATPATQERPGKYTAAAEAEQVGSASGDQLEEIVVTAQRQAESLQNVPIAISTVSGAQLATSGLSNNANLEGAVPNLTMTKTGSAFTPFLRGVGSNAILPTDEPSVATYVDGVYQPSPVGSLLVFNNVERIEVLKGPQGTLFGRNATGGVVQVITRDPTQEPHVEASAGYGNYDTISANLYATTGLADWVAADVAVLYRDQGEGFGHNLVTGSETYKRRDFAIRSKWLFTPTETTKLTLIGSYTKPRSTGNDFQLTPEASAIKGIPYSGRFNTNADLPSVHRLRTYGISLRLDQELGDVQFVSTSAYNDGKELYLIDSDATPVPIVRGTVRQRSKNFAQEFQLLGTSGPLKWQVGAYIFSLEGTFDAVVEGLAAAPLPFVNPIGIQRTHSLAGYAQTTYEFAPRLSATAGIRYTHDKQKFEGRLDVPGGTAFTAPVQKQSDSKPTWRLALDYRASDDLLAYISYNRGLKSGGYNTSTPGTPGFQPETLDAYEVGLKLQLFDRHLRFNVAAFYYDYKNLQVLSQDPTGTGANTENAASARIKGIDADFQAIPFENLTLSGGIGILDSKYLEYLNPLSYTPGGTLVLPPPDVSGNELQNAPKFTASLSANYRIPTTIGDFRISGTGIHKSLSFATSDNDLTFPSYTIFNGNVGWTSNDGNRSIQLWINNAFDKRYYISRVQAAFGYIQSEADPRTYGIKVGLKI